MDTILINCGLGITFAGTFIIVVAAWIFDPVGAFKVTKEENLGFSKDLFKDKVNKLRIWVTVGIAVVWIGMVLQIAGNNIS